MGWAKFWANLIKLIWSPWLFYVQIKFTKISGPSVTKRHVSCGYLLEFFLFLLVNIIRKHSYCPALKSSSKAPNFYDQFISYLAT
jgi:hypothetical protein